MSRPVIARAGVAAALALAAGPAVAATPSVTPAAPPTTARPTAKPTDITCSAAVLKSADGKPERTIIVKSGASGTKTTTVLQVPADAARKGVIDKCQALLGRKIALAFPKGAPETGGGGMAAEVSSWH